MSRVLAGTLLSLAVAATAQAGAGAGPDRPVIGGSNASQGMWPAVAGIVYNGNSDVVDNTLCTGVLVAPTIVLTAGHCVPGVLAAAGGENIGDLTGIVIGTASLSDLSDGELLTGSDGDIQEYPNSQTSIDIGIITLETAAKETPSAIATGWARLDIQNGAKVEFVGFGSIDANGNDYIPQLQDAQSTITDYDCTTSNGCNQAAQPDGELGAGGSGIDTCPGDSGGPMYLLTSYGNFVAGITSRGYSTDTTACGQGGIYSRPDKIVPYIEQKTGVKLTHGPEPTADPIELIPGGPGETVISANDPKSNSHGYTVTTMPAHGTAAVEGSGRVRVCESASGTGSDSVTVTVTDSNDATRAVPITIQIEPQAGTPPAMCDVNAFTVGDSGGGCAAAGGGLGGILGVGAVLLARRRRRS